MINYHFEEKKLEVSAYQAIRKTTGWEMLADEAVENALKNDLYTVSIYSDKKELIGIGRVIGDGALYFYVQDVMVLPEHQGKGIGKRIMQHIEKFLQQHAPKNAFIGLMAAEGVAEFYEQFGFEKRADSRPGMFKML